MSEDIQPNTSFVGDSPLDKSEYDKFRRWPFAQRIAQTIANRRDPSNIVIGIYGAWGEGKTTVLNFIEEELQKFPEIIPIKFNPWRFGNENQLLMSFFEELANSLGRSLSSKKEEIGQTISKYAKFIAPVSGGMSDAVNGLGEMLSGVELEKLKTRLEGFLESAQKRVVIFMDDIDRLNKVEIQSVFRLIKLSADFRYITYILAFDKNMVAAALKEQYPSSDDQAGYNFLEKIIQVPLNIPAANQRALERLCFEGVDEALRIANIQLTNEQIHTYQRHFYESLTLRLKTPRMAKRYSNALTFALPILRGEVAPVDLMLIEGIRIFYPLVYVNIRDNADAYLCPKLLLGDVDNIADEYKQIRELGLTSYTSSERKAINSLIVALFPRSPEKGYSNAWDATWAQEQRVASIYYFDRYFSYAVPQGDVADTQLKALVASLESVEIASIINSLNELIEANNEEAIIRKFTYHSSVLSSVSSAKLALSLAAVSPKLPNPQTTSINTSPFIGAAILISKLVKRLSQSMRYEITEHIAQNCADLAFSFECIRWLHSSAETSEQDRVFSCDEEEKLEQILAERIVKQSNKEIFHLTIPRYASRFYTHWANTYSREATTEYLSARFKEKPEEVIFFLIAFLPTQWISGENIPRKGDLTREHYDAISLILDPEIIYMILIQLYGEELKTAEYTRSMVSTEPTYSLVSKQFAYIHRIVQEEQNKVTNSMNSSESDNLHENLNA